jgi:Tfp pilus assembly protein PilV
MKPSLSSRAAQGFTLIEAMIAMGVLLVSALALASMQTMTTRTNRFGDRMVQASALANDLAESVQRWDYSDSRLAAEDDVTAFDASGVADKWDLGTDETPSYSPQFSDAVSGSHASTEDALGASYTGLSSDVDRDGTADFTRYWNVHTVHFSGGAMEDGKLVQIIVRWKEPGVGYHQVTTSAFKRNPGNVF